MANSLIRDEHFQKVAQGIESDNAITEKEELDKQ